MRFLDAIFSLALVISWQRVKSSQFYISLIVIAPYMLSNVYLTTYRIMKLLDAYSMHLDGHVEGNVVIFNTVFKCLCLFMLLRNTHCFVDFGVCMTTV